MNNEQENSKSSIKSNDEYDEGDDEYDEGDDEYEGDDEEKKKDILLGTIWQEISEIKQKLSVFNRSQVHKFVNDNMKEEVKDIQQKFKQEFKHYKKDNPLRIEVLLLLSDLGITIYEPIEQPEINNNNFKN